MTLAEANKNAAELESAGKIRIAEGIRAEAAAEGLAEVEVQKANAARHRAGRTRPGTGPRGRGRRPAEDAARPTPKSPV